MKIKRIISFVVFLSVAAAVNAAATAADYATADSQTPVVTPTRTSLPVETFYQGSSYDIFIPIGKYLAAGDAESLSAWFAPNLEIVIFGNPSEASKIQAKQIMKAFFKRYKPRSFDITHQAGRDKMKYALGDLNASGEHFLVTIFVSNAQSGSFQIQQLKIERM